ncbi:4,5-dihydroxyphthalate decarboxylase [Pararhizobium mangrovi]|uniref:4,5-dihydroxyphthalate decarboxylase n=1 Tax=Pararhizobium mangrovi TaxID=2590452 RepID=A0A506U3W1_9HYPH|nr:4,5-dihydroxyphthalate decarboxylase [Pararhizobium mangrovi]TPW27695.1 4,5-dihydroxyphthalate decarboxylase [Pararhizobium mangrovi]
MEDHKLDVAFWNYDRTRALADGSVTIDGVDATFHSARIVTEIFEAMIRDRAYDVSELGMSYFLRTMDFEDPPFLAIPVFPNRCFRHSAIYINKASGIERPEDLRGKTIGELALYGHDAGVWPKGMLSDEYGVTPDQCRWVIGGIDFPLKPIDFVPQPHPENVEVSYAEPDDDLGEKLAAGEIDALISADVPKCVLEKTPSVGRLFEDYEQTERDYYRRTGLFPIMHTVVVNKALAADNPDLIRKVYKGFCDAKAVTAEQFTRGMTFNNMALMLPWATKLVEEDRAILGDDWWPYGMEANRKAVDTFLRYHYKQGLSKRRLTCEDIFVSDLMNT